MRKDTAIGMAFSQITMWAIITTTAGTLHIHSITDIQSADQAARAEPLVKTFPNAGEISKIIFALGIIGTETFGHTCSSRFIWLCTIRCV